MFLWNYGTYLPRRNGQFLYKKIVQASEIRNDESAEHPKYFCSCVSVILRLVPCSNFRLWYTFGKLRQFLSLDFSRLLTFRWILLSGFGRGLWDSCKVQCSEELEYCFIAWFTSFCAYYYYFYKFWNNYEIRENATVLTKRVSTVELIPPWQYTPWRHIGGAEV